MTPSTGGPGPATSTAAEDRKASFPRGLPEESGPLTLAQSVNAALTDVLATCPQAIVLGEDVGTKGGVYGVTLGLQKTFGAARVFDTPLDEQTILGLALGASLAGLLPIAEIQYLAYLHNAEDQLRGEAATLGFFSDGQYANGLVVRIAVAGLAQGLRRALPQRQRDRRAARHPRHRGRLRLRRRRGARAAPHPGRARARRGTGRRAARADRALPRQGRDGAVRRPRALARPGTTAATWAGCTGEVATCWS